MDLFLKLVLLSPCLTAFANANFFHQTNGTPKDVRFPREINWRWNPSKVPKNPEPTRKAKGGNKIETGGGRELGKAAKAISSLEISKSIELVFDPKIQALVPAAEIPRKRQRDQGKAHESAIVLLSPKTYAKLKRIFESLKKEGERGENALSGFKNFQTGRFKSKYFKTVQGYAV